MIPKKNKTEFRLVIDYRNLNKVVKTDRFPMPRLGDLFLAFENSTIFSTIDLNQGYFQVLLRKEDRSIIAFLRSVRLYQWCRLPQRYKNNGNVFQRVLNLEFSDLLYRSVVIYVDNLTVYAITFDFIYHHIPSE